MTSIRPIIPHRMTVLIFQNPTIRDHRGCSPPEGALVSIPIGHNSSASFMTHHFNFEIRSRRIYYNKVH